MAIDTSLTITARLTDAVVRFVTVRDQLAGLKQAAALLESEPTPRPGSLAPSVLPAVRPPER